MEQYFIAYRGESPLLAVRTRTLEYPAMKSLRHHIFASNIEGEALTLVFSMDLRRGVTRVKHGTLWHMRMRIEWAGAPELWRLR